MADLTIEARGDGRPARLRGSESTPAKTRVSAANCRPARKIEVRELFAATPARLKFLRPRAPKRGGGRCGRAAGHGPSAGAVFVGGDGGALSTIAPAGTFCARRIFQVLGGEFAANAFQVEAVREDVRLWGFAGLPTYTRGNAPAICFVNGRPVRDKLFAGAIRAAYMDFLGADRHPVAGAFYRLRPRGSTSTSIRPRRRCASPIRGWCAVLSSAR